MESETEWEVFEFFEGGVSDQVRRELTLCRWVHLEVIARVYADYLVPPYKHKLNRTVARNRLLS